jgi:hypothetical protein
MNIYIFKERIIIVIVYIVVEKTLDTLDSWALFEIA